MRKRLFYITSLLSMCLLFFLITGCSENNVYTNENSGTNHLEENKSAETTTSKNEDINYPDDTSANSLAKSTIKSDRNPIWSDQEHDAAEKEANKFMDALKNKDMTTISGQIDYPLQITDINGKRIDFNKKEQFSSFEFDKLFDEKFVDNIAGAEELFSNCYGFMLGGGDCCVWFTPSEDGKISIYSIITNHSSTTTTENDPISQVYR